MNLTKFLLDKLISFFFLISLIFLIIGTQIHERILIIIGSIFLALWFTCFYSFITYVWCWGNKKRKKRVKNEAFEKILETKIIPTVYEHNTFFEYYDRNLFYEILLVVLLENDADIVIKYWEDCRIEEKEFSLDVLFLRFKDNMKKGNVVSEVDYFKKTKELEQKIGKLQNLKKVFDEYGSRDTFLNFVKKEFLNHSNRN
jgi:hypothetical protein